MEKKIDTQEVRPLAKTQAPGSAFATHTHHLPRKGQSQPKFQARHPHSSGMPRSSNLLCVKQKLDGASVVGKLQVPAGIGHQTFDSLHGLPGTTDSGCQSD